VSLAAQM